MAKRKKSANPIGDPWHYPRPDLAKHFLNRFKIAGNKRGVHFFAPRRKGKTQFLLLDLAPEAVKRRYTVVYASMWDDHNRPQRALLKALERAKAAKTRRRGVLAGGIEGALKGLRAKAAFKGIEISAEMEFASNPKSPTSEELEAIESLVVELGGRDERHALLLMIDEVQHLATKEEFAPIAAKLKTLSERYDGVDMVLTGSSRTGPSELFGDGKPLHNVTQPEGFLDLDEGFVEHLAKAYAFVTNGKSLKVADLMKLFEAVDKSPFYMRGVIEAMILQPNLSIKEAHQSMMDGVAMTGRYEERWSDLKAIDRLVLRKAINGEPLYNDETLKEFTKAVHGRKKNKEVSRGLVQSSVRRLTELHYITPRVGIRGRYDIEMIGFGDWLKKRISEE